MEVMTIFSLKRWEARMIKTLPSSTKRLAALDAVLKAYAAAHMPFLAIT